SVDIGVFGFFYVSGNFAFEKSTQSITVTGDSHTTDVDALLIGASGVSAFAGINGPASNASALGLSLTGVAFALALLKGPARLAPAPATTDLRTWTALKASVGTASFVGIDGLTVAVNSLTVEINQAGGTLNGAAASTVADFKTTGLTVNTGGGHSMALDFDGSKGKLLKAEGSVDIGVFGFFYVSGNFAFEKSTQSITVTGDSHTTDVDALLIGASGVSAFAGINGPASNASALGLSLTGVDFALALLKAPASVPPAPETTDLRTWTALKASVGTASFVGIDGLTVAVNSLTVEINQAGGTLNGAAASTVADFKTTGLTVNTGGGHSMALDFDGSKGKLLKAEGSV